MDIPIDNQVTASVVLKNKFAVFCLDDEADPSVIVNKIAQIKKAEKTSINKVPKTTASASTNLPKPEKSQNITATKEGSATRGRGRGRGNGREGARDYRRDDESRRDDKRRDENRREGTRNHRRDENHREVRTEDERRFDGNRRHRSQHENETAFVEDEEKVDGNRRLNRGGNGNRRPYRGGARGDRTGVHDAPKKDGYGKGNWGTEQDELQGETEPLGERTIVEKSAQEDNADKNDSGVELEKEDDKPIGMTLNEWKEKNKAIEPEIFNVRKPNDDKKLNLAPLKKVEDENKENEEFVVLRREPREKHVDISVNFAATTTTDRTSGSNRGNRDGFRGRKRGGDRGLSGETRNDRSRANNSQFHLVNDHFPALGGQ